MFSATIISILLSITSGKSIIQIRQFIFRLALRLAIVISLSIITFPHINKSSELKLIYDNSIFRDGDIIFRQGIDLLSNIVLSTDNSSPYSHVGIIKISDNSPFVIHAITGEPIGSQGQVKIEPLASFLASDKASYAALYRLDEDHKISSIAAANVAYTYAIKEIPFDLDFNLNTPNELYCTELVWRSYKEAGIDIVDNNFDSLNVPFGHGSYLLPSTLLKSRWLRIVANINNKL